MSYTYIIRTILRFPSAQQRKRAFSTCSSHIIVVSITYGTCIFIYIKPHAKEGVAINKVVSVLTTSVAPVMNPFIYTLRNKQVVQAFKDMIKRVEGICKACGQIQQVRIEEGQGAFEANIEATRKCGCDGSREIVAWWGVRKELQRVCSWESAALGFRPIPDKTQEELLVVCGSVNEGRIDKAQINAKGSTITIVKKDSKVKISRKMSLEIDGESEATE